ncbi:MAG: TIGR04282 family arsenosugar biosynthesis glycosyltransferase [Alphaproteobacteria bacterium]
MVSSRRSVASAFAARLVVMAKEPKAGVVKRRLATGIGAAEAMRFFRTTLRHTLMRVGADPRWRTYLAVTPDASLSAPCWPRWPRITLLPQGDGDLGQRMQHLFDVIPPGPAVVIGSDIPAINAGHVAEAFKSLRGADAVFGPAEDGGYWLVGLRRCPRRLAPFDGVPWSTDRALAVTRQNLSSRKVALVARLSDVDTAGDFKTQRRFAERLVLPRAHPA